MTLICPVTSLTLQTGRTGLVPLAEKYFIFSWEFLQIQLLSFSCCAANNKLLCFVIYSVTRKTKTHECEAIQKLNGPQGFVQKITGNRKTAYFSFFIAWDCWMVFTFLQRYQQDSSSIMQQSNDNMVVTHCCVNSVTKSHVSFLSYRQNRLCLAFLLLPVPDFAYIFFPLDTVIVYEL